MRPVTVSANKTHGAYLCHPLRVHVTDRPNVPRGEHSAQALQVVTGNPNKHKFMFIRGSVTEEKTTRTYSEYPLLDVTLTENVSSSSYSRLALQVAS